MGQTTLPSRGWLESLAHGPSDARAITTTASVPAQSICDRFEAIVRQDPDGPAMQDLQRRLTYAELKREVDRVARAAVLVGRAGPVGLFTPLDARFPIAFLGALTAGRVVIPLDPEHPDDRSRHIAQHAGVVAVFAAGKHLAQARKLFTPDLSVLDVDADDGPERPAERPRADDLAYVLYTSGSTGAPKGVAHSHANAVNDAEINRRIYGLVHADRTSVFYAGTMGCVRHTLGGLLNGAELHILPARQLGAEALVQEMRARRITVFQCVPTLFRRIAGAVPAGERLDSVRMVRLIGDRSDWNDVDLFKAAFPAQARLEVAIGSTECSSTYAHWYVDETARTETGRLPVGRPIAGLDVQILDDKGSPAPAGEVGEAVVASRFLALGYWGEPELTDDAFKTDPLDPSVRIFATGDMCLRRADGLIEFVGRKDQLLKLRGHRLEPAEVESALLKCAGVADAVVVVRRIAQGSPRALAAYVELQAKVKGLLPRHVLAMVSQKLPAYMVPAVIYVRSLPRLPNFKPDREALKREDAAHADDASARLSDPLLDKVARVFEAVVKCSGATGEDSLLSLGGDSLQAVELVLELEHQLGLRIPEQVFRVSPNISELSRWIGRQKARSG